MSEWQPIETAPKDGTRILVFGTWPLRRAEVARWIGAPHSFWKAEAGGQVERATHWQPLAEPPQ